MNIFRGFISWCIVTSFLVCNIGSLPQAQAASAFTGIVDPIIGLPVPGILVNLSPTYEPAIIKGLTIHKDNPFLFDFIIDIGQNHLSGEPLKKEGEKLIKYFLTGLTSPAKDVWVNLSPYERNKMIPETLSQTDMGLDLLEQDYILKQITASLIYPERHLGKVFWGQVYAKAQAMYGTTQIPVNTFNKVWILADRAQVFEHDQTAFVVDCHLKVMLEEDYLALQKHSIATPWAYAHDSHFIGANIVRQIILPELEKEVNTGKNFANLRQIFNSIILSSWFKHNLKQSILNQVYANQNKIKGVELPEAESGKEVNFIYDLYLKAYKKGVFNYIKEEVNAQGVPVARKYFSGGINEAMAGDPAISHDFGKLAGILRNRRLVSFETGLRINAAMLGQVSNQQVFNWNGKNGIRSLDRMVVSQTIKEIDEAASQKRLDGLTYDVVHGLASNIFEVLLRSDEHIKFESAKILAYKVLWKTLDEKEQIDVRMILRNIIDTVPEVSVGAQKILKQMTTRNRLSDNVHGIPGFKVGRNAKILTSDLKFLPDLEKEQKTSSVSNYDIQSYVDIQMADLAFWDIFHSLGLKKFNAQLMRALTDGESRGNRDVWKQQIAKSKKLEESDLQGLINLIGTDPQAFMRDKIVPSFYPGHGLYAYQLKVPSSAKRRQIAYLRAVLILAGYKENTMPAFGMGKIKEGTQVKDLRGDIGVVKKVGPDGRMLDIEFPSEDLTMKTFLKESMLRSQLLVLPNFAMRAPSALLKVDNSYGGIDLTLAHGVQTDLQNGHEIEMSVDSAMLDRVRRTGINSLSPVIIKITPVTNIGTLIGLQASEIN